MKYLTVALLFALVACVVCLPYSTEYDNFNYKEVIKNDRLTQNYCNCILGKGGCTKEGKKLLEYIPDAIQSRCSRCTEKQKAAAKDVLGHLKQRKARECFNPLVAKYDPNNQYRAELDQFLSS